MTESTTTCKPIMWQNTECLFYLCPKHCSFHGVSSRMQALHLTKLPWSGMPLVEHLVLLRNVNQQNALCKLMF